MTYNGNFPSRKFPEQLIFLYVSSEYAALTNNLIIGRYRFFRLNLSILARTTYLITKSQNPREKSEPQAKQFSKQKQTKNKAKLHLPAVNKVSLPVNTNTNKSILS